MQVYSEKQLQLLSLWQHDKLRRLNILEGSVRSGKTWISLVLWAFWIACAPKNASYLMAAKTLTSLSRNVLELLVSLVGNKNFQYSLSKKEGTLFGRKIYFEGASDSRSENKIRGLSLAGAYCDEVSLFEEDFFKMLLSRLSDPGAKLFATTNPDSPTHWLKTQYLDRADELDILQMKFLIDDNIFLDRSYVENLKKEYTGVFYDRYILGLWKAAEGVIYPQFAENCEGFIEEVSPEEIAFASIGVDFGGNKSAHAFVCTGFTASMEKVVVLDEFYLKETISPKQLEDCFVSFVSKCKSRYRIFDIYCDCAETTLIQGLTSAALNARLGVDVRLSLKKPILDRIRFTNAMMSKDRFKISASCKNVISALRNAVWDSKSLCDKRLDDGSVNVDSLDALEYSFENFMQDIIL